MEPADSRQPSNVFSPAAQYRDANAKLSPGAHHMILVAAENDLYEREVQCFIDGTKVGVLHEDEAYDYYVSIKKLSEHGMELVVPCSVHDNGMIYYRPVTRESLRDWVDAQTQKAEAPSAETTGSAPAVLPATVSSRVTRHLIKLLSQDWFSPLDAKIMDRFAHGLYWHEQHTVDGSIGIQQGHALVLATYALHRISSPLVKYDENISLGKDDDSKFVLPVIVIDDIELIDMIITTAHEWESKAKLIMEGSSPEEWIEPQTSRV